MFHQTSVLARFRLRWKSSFVHNAENAEFPIYFQSVTVEICTQTYNKMKKLFARRFLSRFLRGAPRYSGLVKRHSLLSN